MKVDIEKVKEQAKKELEEAAFQKAVEEEKDRLRKKKSFWDIIFPYKIIIIKKGDVDGFRVI